jgi:hypothetical protein
VNLTVAAALCSGWAYNCGSATLKGSLMARLISVIVTAPIILVGAASDAQSPSCGCPNARPIQARAEGDGSPLNWAFSAILRAAPSDPSRPRIICYYKMVENRSAQEVRDILWRVAGYQRTVIPPNSSRPACVDFAGEIKTAPEQGPLNFGTSSQAYDTTVWQPATGWLPKSTATETTSFEPLRSQFSFDTETKQFEPLIRLRLARCVASRRSRQAANRLPSWRKR